MIEYVSYHKIIQLIEDYQISQVGIGLNSFGHGNIVEFGASPSGNTPTYPFLFATPISVSYDENITTWTIQLIFADRINDDLSNEIDVISDMSIQAKRFMSYIKRGFNQTPDLYNRLDCNLPVTAQPIMERFNDFIGGVSLDIEIIVFEDINACDYYGNDVSPTPQPTPTPTPTPEPPTPFSMAVYQGVPDNQFFYASIFDGNGNYYAIVNLNGVNESPVLYQFPATELISTQLGYAEDTGLIVDEFPCYGFQVGNSQYPGASIHLEYLNCNGNFVVEDISDEGTYNFCGRYLLAGTYQNGKSVVQYGLCDDPLPSPTPTPTPSATPPVVYYLYNLESCSTLQNIGLVNIPYYTNNYYEVVTKNGNGECGFGTIAGDENPAYPYSTEYWLYDCVPCQST